MKRFKFIEVNKFHSELEIGLFGFWSGKYYEWELLIYLPKRGNTKKEQKIYFRGRLVK